MSLMGDALAHTLATQGKALAERLDRLIELLEEIRDELKEGGSHDPSE